VVIVGIAFAPAMDQLCVLKSKHDNYDIYVRKTLTPIFMNKMLALKFVLSIVSRHLIGQF
jgi:hypothetical protein